MLAWSQKQRILKRTQKQAIWKWEEYKCSRWTRANKKSNPIAHRSEYKSRAKKFHNIFNFLVPKWVNNAITIEFQEKAQKKLSGPEDCGQHVRWMWPTFSTWAEHDMCEKIHLHTQDIFQREAARGPCEQQHPIARARMCTDSMTRVAQVHARGSPGTCPDPSTRARSTHVANWSDSYTQPARLAQQPHTTHACTASYLHGNLFLSPLVSFSYFSKFSKNSKTSTNYPMYSKYHIERGFQLKLEVQERPRYWKIWISRKKYFINYLIILDYFN